MFTNHALLLSALIITSFLHVIFAQNTIVSVLDSSLSQGAAWLQEAVSQAQRKSGLTLSQNVVSVSLDDEEAGENQFCSALYSGASVVVDLTAGGWIYGHENAAAHGVPYVRVQISNYQWMDAIDELLQSRNATDAALIFGSESRKLLEYFLLVPLYIVKLD
ncbi:hypothetical protein SK128_006921 [Halocaridina rubra]|uniref:Receptor ligand binding region domain-containing protein n=1 Tax=Halocaridina rubra TaxID=373956 RepID=A0AAN8XN66_HALRR